MKTIYNIENTVNLDTHSCFNDENSYPKFQKELIKFKTHLKQLVYVNASKTFYKFGDGDYQQYNTIIYQFTNLGCCQKHYSLQKFKSYIFMENLNSLCTILLVDPIYFK